MRERKKQREIKKQERERERTSIYKDWVRSIRKSVPKASQAQFRTRKLKKGIWIVLSSFT